MSLRIGIVDLDTSHPSSFVPIMRELGHDVVAVWDRGTVRDAGFATEFASIHGIEHVVPPERMQEIADAVYLNAVNWEKHVPTARAFVEAGIPVFINKPLAGSTADIAQLRQWRRDGAVITGGSALAWCSEATHARAEETIEYATIWCAGHPLDYGIHAHSLAVGLMGADIEAVRHLGGTPRRMELRFSDGRIAHIIVDALGRHLPFRASILTPNGMKDVVPDPNSLYRSFLRATLPRLAGEIPLENDRDTVAAESSSLADLASERRNGAWVALDDLPDDTAYDGAEFAAYYQSRYAPPLTPAQHPARKMTP